MANSTFISNLPPVKKREARLIRASIRNANQSNLYIRLRALQGVYLSSYRQLALDLGVRFPGQVQRSLEGLARLGLVVKSTEGEVNVWTVAPMESARSAPQGFRGHSEIVVRPYTPGLPAALSVYEQEQLFGALRREPYVASLYLFLRSRLGADFTKSEAAQLFQSERRIVNQRLARLVELRLVSELPREGVVLVHFVDCGLDAPVDDEDLDAWLTTEAMVPTAFSLTQALLARGSASANATLVLDFYNKCMAARADNSASGVRTGAGQKTRSAHIASTLVASQTFNQLMPALLFYCLEWRGSNVDQYGRTLMTFQKNLSAIVEELNDFLPSDRNYVHNKMKRYGLNAFFPLPDLLEKPVHQINPQVAAKLAAERADWDTDEEDPELDAQVAAIMNGTLLTKDLMKQAS